MTFFRDKQDLNINALNFEPIKANAIIFGIF